MLEGLQSLSFAFGAIIVAFAWIGYELIKKNNQLKKYTKNKD